MKVCFMSGIFLIKFGQLSFNPLILNYMEFTHQEKRLIINAVELRRGLEEDHKSSLSAIDSILNFIKNPFLKLTSFEMAFLRGCVKEYSIYPNEALLWLSDYEVFESKDELHDTFDFVDTGLSILAKLKDEHYGKARLFRTVMEKVKKFSAITTVYYSLSDTKIYKAGVLIDGKKGFKIETSHPEFSEFEVVPVSKDQYMYEGSPSEIISKIKAYERDYARREENHGRLLTILELASN